VPLYCPWCVSLLVPVVRLVFCLLHICTCTTELYSSTVQKERADTNERTNERTNEPRTKFHLIERIILTVSSHAMTLSVGLLTVLRPVGRTAGRAFATSKANGGSFAGIPRSAEPPSKSTLFAQPSTESAPTKTNPAATAFGLDESPSSSNHFNSFSESSFAPETPRVDVPPKPTVKSRSMLSSPCVNPAILPRLSLCQFSSMHSSLFFSTAQPNASCATQGNLNEFKPKICIIGVGGAGGNAGNLRANMKTPTIKKCPSFFSYALL